MALIIDVVSYWKLDEQSGTDVIDAHGSNDLTNTGATVNQTGKINTGYTHSVNDYLTGTVVGLPTGASPRTVSFWIYPTASTASYPFSYGTASTRQGFGVIQSSTSWRVWVNGDDLIGTTGAALNEWTHIVATYDGTDTRLFINGVYDAVKTHTLNTTLGTNLHLGTYINQAIGITGTLDEVGLWDAALTYGGVSVGETAGGEIAELYNSGSGLAYPFTAEGTNTQINIGDNWKEISAVQIQIGDTWKEVTGMQINIGDNWKEVF